MCMVMMHGLHNCVNSNGPSRSSLASSHSQISNLLVKHVCAKSPLGTENQIRKMGVKMMVCLTKDPNICALPVSHHQSQADLSKIVGYLEKQKTIQAESLCEQHQANDINDHTSTALIDI